MVSLPDVQVAALCEVALKFKSMVATGLVPDPPFSVPTPVDVSKVRLEASTLKDQLCPSLPVPPVVTVRSSPTVSVSATFESATVRIHDCPLVVLTAAPALLRVRNALAGARAGAVAAKAVPPRDGTPVSTA